LGKHLINNSLPLQPKLRFAETLVATSPPPTPPNRKQKEKNKNKERSPNFSKIGLLPAIRL
jgi:hypothetical protein